MLNNKRVHLPDNSRSASQFKCKFNVAIVQAQRYIIAIFMVSSVYDESIFGLWFYYDLQKIKYFLFNKYLLLNKKVPTIEYFLEVAGELLLLSSFY